MNMTKKLISAACFAGLLVSAPAYADDEGVGIETSHVRDRKEIELDPTKAYILVQSPAQVVFAMFKEPSQEERDIVAAERAEAYVEAREKYERKLERYNRTRERYEQRGRPVPGREPDLVSEETFSWPSAEQQLMFMMGPQNRFSKDGVSLYLHEVPEGTYVYQGSMWGTEGTCACMGSIKFEARAGQITTLQYASRVLGDDGVPIEDADELKAYIDDMDSNDVRTRLSMVVSDADELARDPRLPADWIVPAEFQPVPFIPNWFGEEINRVMPIDGVMRYERDQMIDVKEEIAAAEEAARLEAERIEAERLAAEQAAAEAAAQAEAEAAAAAEEAADASEGSGVRGGAPE